MLKAEQPKEEEKKKKNTQKVVPAPKTFRETFRRIWGNENAKSEIMDQDCRSQSPQERTNWVCTHGEKGCLCCVRKGRRARIILKHLSLLSTKSIKGKNMYSRKAATWQWLPGQKTPEKLLHQKGNWGSLNCCLFTMDFLGSWSLSSDISSIHM